MANSYFPFENRPQIEATNIAPGLYQGSVPPYGNALRDAKFSLVVLAAREYQPVPDRYPGVRTLNVPLDDSLTPSESELYAAGAAADTVSKYVRDGKKVLVTCMMGRNRSGLIVALTLMKLLGWNGKQAVAHIKARRANALTNSSFVSILERIQVRRG